MSTYVSPLADVHPRAELGADVFIGPFCVVGPDVRLGDRSRLDSHVTIVGHTTIGPDNRFFPNCVIGAEPQDLAYSGAPTRVEIGCHNVFREGVTVNRGAEKEDHCTRIGDGNMLMANCHVAHNCRLYDRVILVNGVLLGGHVHVHDGAIVSGNSVVHHFSTLGTLSFVSGGCRVPHDVPPYMLAAGSDHPTIKTLNFVGLRRAGIGEDVIRLLKRAHRLLFREHRKLDESRAAILSEAGGILPRELETLFTAIEQQQRGHLGRAREAIRKERGLSVHYEDDAPEAQRRAA